MSNPEDNRKKSDNLDFLDPQVHEYYKKKNKKVNYDDNMPSFRHIHVGSVRGYDVEGYNNITKEKEM